MSSEADSVIVSFPSQSAEDRRSREDWFIGDVDVWSRIRSRKFGDFVVAKHMYIEWFHGERHSVAWVERSGKNPDTGEPFCMHHIICDCAREDEDAIDQYGFTSDCPVLLNGLTERSRQIGAEYRIPETLNALEGYLGAEQKPDIYHDIALTAIEEALRLDVRQPQSWLGNILSGQHEVGLISEMMNLPPEQVRLYLDILEINGTVVLNGDTVKINSVA